MTVTCRIAEPADVPALVHLMAQLGYSVDDAEIQAVLSAIRKGSGEVFVAESGGNVVGCIDAIIDVRLAEGKVGEIASLVVRADCRGSGVGKALLGCAEDWLTGSVETVRIRANAKRADAHAFYASVGYAHIKEQKVFIKDL